MYKSQPSAGSRSIRRRRLLPSWNGSNKYLQGDDDIDMISGIIKVFGFLLISETGRGFTGDGRIHGCSDNS